MPFDKERFTHLRYSNKRTRRATIL